MLDRPPNNSELPRIVRGSSRRRDNGTSVRTEVSADRTSVRTEVSADQTSVRTDVRREARRRHAEAQRRRRQREKNGTLMVTLAITVDETDKLHTLQYLAAAGLEDRNAIAAAIKALLAGIRVE